MYARRSLLHFLAALTDKKTEFYVTLYIKKNLSVFLKGYSNFS
jgi:hypothetical protein